MCNCPYQAGSCPLQPAGPGGRDAETVAQPLLLITSFPSVASNRGQKMSPCKCPGTCLPADGVTALLLRTHILTPTSLFLHTPPLPHTPHALAHTIPPSHAFPTLPTQYTFPMIIPSLTLPPTLLTPQPFPPSPLTLYLSPHTSPLLSPWHSISCIEPKSPALLSQKAASHNSVS